MKRRQSGIALLEAVIAVMILAIGLLGTIGLQARAMGALADASMRAEATMATEKLLGVMSNDQGNLTAYALASGGTPTTRLQSWYDETRGVIPNAVISVAVTATSATQNKIDVQIQWTRKAGDPTNTHKVTAYIASSS